VIDPVLAHQGGWDEMAIFLFPIFFGLGFWLITRRRRDTRDEEEAQGGSPDKLAADREPTPLPKDGAERLRSLMNPKSSADAPPIAREHQGEAE
jgi:hypothetical protein